MRLEIPTLRVNHPEARAALSRARGLLVEKFEPVTGSDIIPLKRKPGTEGVRVNATDKGVPLFYDPNVDHVEVKAELWVPNPDMPDRGSDYTVTHYRVTTDGDTMTRTTEVQSHLLLVHFGSGVDINGVMSATTLTKEITETFDEPTGKRRKKETLDETEEFIRSAEQIDVFLGQALQSIALD